MNNSFKSLGTDAIHQALAALGAVLGPGNAIELLIVGGAAGLLTHLLPGSVTTSDVDAVHFRPPNEIETVLQAAQIVADKQGISRAWLNTDAGLYFNVIPPDWESRRADISLFGRLHVYAIGRLDLICMKFFAHRGIDLEHLARMKVEPEELLFAAHHLRALVEILPDDRNKIEMAIHIVESWDKM